MASAGGIRGFYREKKKGGVTKPSPKPYSTADPACSPVLKSAHVQGQEKEAEERLREFDMDMRYGPCLGLTRTERWNRAAVMGLNPSPDVEAILLKCSSSAALECLWEGRV
ncbi:DNA polymerase delta subunit 4-like [Phoenix dactylifera]|uniref:DNA polymerase delta subunit 4-like n=1 Tax=Phoenix dactylifera TaxID=42345 RepID=A0A8B8ZVI6_PHODC|nr:DNA polymerase delta subunit 4-like [Phoenix dactylifera]